MAYRRCLDRPISLHDMIQDTHLERGAIKGTKEYISEPQRGHGRNFLQKNLA